MNTDIDISKIRKVDGGLLLVLQQLLEHRSVTRTAASLNLGQSTISHSLTRLRELFNDPLFIRRPHGLEPTQRAVELKPKVDALLNLTRETLDIGHAFQPDQSQRLFSISAPEFIAVTTATSLLKRLEEQAPNVGVRFLHLPEADVFDELRRGEIDVAVGRFENTPGDLQLTLLYEDEFCIACRKGHSITQGRLSIGKYLSASHIWADSPSETIARDSEFDFSKARGSIVPRWLTALTIAASSDHIATCPRRLAESQAKLFDLVLLKPPQRIPIQVFLACRDNVQDQGTEWFIEQISATFN